MEAIDVALPLQVTKRLYQMGCIAGITLLFWAVAIYAGKGISEDGSLLTGVICNIILWCVCLPLIFLLPIAIHEAGHFLFGWRAGFSSRLFIVGPFRFHYEEQRWHFSLQRRWQDWFSGKYAGMQTAGDHQTLRYALMILGGPLASLLMAVPGAVYVYTRVSMQQAGYTPLFLLIQEGVIRQALMLCSLLSGLILINCLLPLRSNPLRSDGSTLCILFTGGSDAKRYLAMISMYFSYQENLSPLAWSYSLVQRAVSQADGSEDNAYGCYFAYLWHQARGEQEHADVFLWRAVESANRMSSHYRSEIYLDAAFNAAFYRKDVVAACRFFTMYRSMPGHTALRGAPVEAAILFVEGDPIACRRCAQEALREMGKKGHTQNTGEQTNLKMLIRRTEQLELPILT